MPNALVKPFPTGGPAVPLGFTTLNYAWSSDGKQIYYMVAPDVFEVDLQTTPSIRAGIPRRLFLVRELVTSGVFPSFDVTSDGERFLTLVSGPDALIHRVVVVAGVQSEIDVIRLQPDR